MYIKKKKKKKIHDSVKQTKSIVATKGKSSQQLIQFKPISKIPIMVKKESAIKKANGSNTEYNNSNHQAPT